MKAVAVQKIELTPARWWWQWDRQFRGHVADMMESKELARHEAAWLGDDEAVARLNSEIDSLRGVYIWSCFDPHRIGAVDFGLPSHDDATPLDYDMMRAWESFLSGAPETRAIFERFLDGERSRLESGPS